MRSPSDAVMAKRMLETRREGGYRLDSSLRKSVKRYLIMAIGFGAGLALIASTGNWVAIAFCLGLILGAWLRDFAWHLASQRAWPFTAKIINREIVENVPDLDSVSSDRARTV